jgi:hypothetical protein
MAWMSVRRCGKETEDVLISKVCAFQTAKHVRTSTASHKADIVTEDPQRRSLRDEIKVYLLVAHRSLSGSLRVQFNEDCRVIREES